MSILPNPLSTLIPAGIIIQGQFDEYAANCVTASSALEGTEPQGEVLGLESLRAQGGDGPFLNMASPCPASS